MNDESSRVTPIPTAPVGGADAAAPPSTQLRTVALCDLVDSTALIERLGDRRAADLFRRHDRVARDLLYRHHGREIDKTDGFLVLFERPIHAVAFALDYQRALRDLAVEEKVDLAARVGVHVGDVLLWENAAEDVAKGAKPTEVEGLAKPLAARLMSLARPGQVLLSGMAHNLAQRAQEDLGPIAEKVRWPAHGRYRFKGLPAPLLVYEVGEVGIAPLKAPPSSSKAQRELPLWRQPRALALEALVAMAAVLALMFVLVGRPQPAIAFGERDWVVVGDLRNLTGDPSVEAALATAFRISLEQSRFVNVLPELALQNALERMQQPGDTTVDRAVGSEIAVREGARALILPTVADIGGRIRVSAEVVDPHTQTTVYAEAADGVGLDSSLESMDAVTARLRLSLGETLRAIERDSAPLPQVTGGDLEALKEYSEGLQAVHGDNLERAARHFGAAIARDPGFSLAHIGLARIAYRGDDHARVHTHVTAALQHRKRLTARDALYLDAWSQVLSGPLQSIQRWRLLLELYPDYHAGAYNQALLAWENATDYASAEKATAEADVQANPRRSAMAYLRASLLTAMDRVDEAITLFERADVAASRGRALHYAAAYLAAGDHARAETAFASGSNTGDPAADAWRELFAPQVALDRGEFARARSGMRGAANAGDQVSADLGRGFRIAGIGMDVALDPSGAREPLRALGAAHLAATPVAGSGALPRHASQLAVLAYLAARTGDYALAQAWAERASQMVDVDEFPAAKQLLALAGALRLSADGEHGRASEATRSLLTGSELYQVHVVQALVHTAAGNELAASEDLAWLREHRGRVFGEYGVGNALTFLNISDHHDAALRQAELAITAGDMATATLRLADFQQGWKSASTEASLEARIDSVESAIASARP